MNPSPDSLSSDSVVLFSNDNEYLEYIRVLRDGYVLTSNKYLTPSFTVIHKVTCEKIRTLSGNAKPGGFTNKYIKVYALNAYSLKTWVMHTRKDGSFRECSICC